MPSENRPSSNQGGGAHDPVAAAVFNAVARSNVSAFAIRRMPRAPDATEPAFILWLVGAGRFCLTVRPGRLILLRDAWHLDTEDGRQRMPSPLAQAWDEALLVSRDAHRLLKRRVSFLPAVHFPDTEPDAHIRQIARRGGVAMIRELHGTIRTLAHTAATDPQLNPPTTRQALEELTALTKTNANAPPTGPPPPLAQSHPDT